MKYFHLFETYCDLTDLFLSPHLLLLFPFKFKSTVMLINGYISVVLRLVTDRCFLKFLRDNQNQESRFEHGLLEGETDRRRSERNREPDT